MIPALVLALTMAQQAPQRWEHVLVRHETFEDFYADGLASAYRTEINAHAPVHVTAGPIPDSTDPNEAALAQAEEWTDGFYESREILVPGGFHDALVSWNVQCSPRAGMCMELRVRAKDGDWSPWLWVGEWGEPSPPPLYLRRNDPGGPRVDASAPRTTEFTGGKIDVDYFKSEQSFERAQYRVRTAHEAKVAGLTVRLRRVALCFSRRVDGAPAAAPIPRAHQIEVPFLSQTSESADIAGRICSPTSVAMVLRYRGVNAATADVAKLAFDARHDIYGNWPRAVQTAYSLGVPGYVTRLASWGEVEELLRKDQPLVISIAAAKGALSGAPYPSTNGHLLVLTGFDDKGDVRVNDPAAADAQRGRTVYERSELDQVWLARGGTAYVLLPRER
jgi:hypothetical protein